MGPTDITIAHDVSILWHVKWTSQRCDPICLHTFICVIVPSPYNHSLELHFQLSTAKKVEKKQVSEETSESGKEESVPPLNVPQPSELTTEKLLKQAMPPAAAPAPSPPATKNKKKKPEPNVLTLMGKFS